MNCDMLRTTLPDLDMVVLDELLFTTSKERVISMMIMLLLFLRGIDPSSGGTKFIPFLPAEKIASVSSNEEILGVKYTHTLPLSPP